MTSKECHMMSDRKSHDIRKNVTRYQKEGYITSEGISHDIRRKVTSHQKECHTTSKGRSHDIRRKVHYIYQMKSSNVRKGFQWAKNTINTIN